MENSEKTSSSTTATLDSLCPGRIRVHPYEPDSDGEFHHDGNCPSLEYDTLDEYRQELASCDQGVEIDTYEPRVIHAETGALCRVDFLDPRWRHMGGFLVGIEDVSTAEELEANERIRGEIREADDGQDPEQAGRMAAARVRIGNLMYAAENFTAADVRRGREAARTEEIRKMNAIGDAQDEERKKENAALLARADAVAVEIREWDCQRLGDLRKWLNELAVVCDATGRSTGGYVDMCELPTVAIPDEVTDYPVWAMDMGGECLVGCCADEIESLAYIVDAYDVELDELIEHEARKEGFVLVSADDLAAVDPAKIRELGHDGPFADGSVLRWHRPNHVIVEARKIFGARWAYRDLNLDPARVDEIAEKVRDHGREMKSHDAEYIAEALLCGEPVYVFDSGSDGEDDILVGLEAGIREELEDFFGEWREHWTLTATHLEDGEIAY